MRADFQEKVAILQVSYAVTTSNTNKCPHGFPVGTCPICSGSMGGASKDKNTPRKAGEMSYNECMAEWRKIQAQQKADLKEQLDLKKEFLLQFLSNKPIINLEKITQFQEKIMQNIEKLPTVLKTPLKMALNIVNNVVNFALSTINNVQKFVQAAVLNIVDFTKSVAEKLPMVLFEMKNFVSSKLEQIIKPVETILTLFIGNKNKEDKDKKDKNRKKVKEILKKLFKLYFKEKDDNNKDSQ